MQCINPLSASLKPDGTINFDKKQYDQKTDTLKFPCRKCLPCRLNNGREKAIRAFHETQMHEDNIFLTLTYSDENLKSPRLIYEDFQKFMKDLRNHIYYSDPTKKINRMVTGEYGDKNKRPHWHAIIFNWSPPDKTYHTTTDRGDYVYTSELIDSLWKKNDPKNCPSLFGDVTMDSASYVARYAAKKLVHGKDDEHNYNPIHKTPNKRGMGKSWIEKYHEHTFQNGFVVLPNGELSKIPRYYVEWCKNHKPDLYNYYDTKVLPKIIETVKEKTEKEDQEYLNNFLTGPGVINRPLTRSKVKETILQRKFKKLQEMTKL